ncbi:MAG: NAD-dependent epimerase/dehydratase family protein [Planctomyces sp.]|nr:NAD-dependent epimerase/dehydratase family protein [Planctomyces sp.]
MARDGSESERRLLVTGATGLVGRHVVERALNEGWDIAALVRQPEACAAFEPRGVRLIPGSLTDADSIARAAAGVTHVVHCAAKVGDWGPVEAYREVNVQGLRNLLRAFENSAALKRFVHVSSLGVYPARDHYGTDESTPPSASGIDGYTRSKVEAEAELLRAVRDRGLPGVIVRPGFIYGPGDRSVLPRLLERLAAGQFRYLGDPDRLMNNTCVANLIDAIWLVLNRDDLAGEAFNVTDGRLVSKREFVSTVARLAGLPEPTRVVPLGLARGLATLLETIWRWRCRETAPVLSRARIKFLGLNLDFSIDKAKRVLGYNPRVDFQQGIVDAMSSLQEPPAP